ncbi:MAG: sigma-70 family RNA polymerase sigma factor [Herpetosiphon sp.]
MGITKNANVDVDQVDDGTYVRALAGGNKQALEALFNRYQKAVYQTAVGLTRDPELAEEILQDTFFRLYRTAPRLDTTTPLGPWLHRVTINLCYSRLRSVRAWTSSLQQLAERLFSPRTTWPEQRAEHNQMHDVVHATLAGLEMKHRVVLVLYYLHDYSVAEIAEITGVPHGTVKSRLFHARKLLRQRLEAQGGKTDLLPDPA